MQHLAHRERFVVTYVSVLIPGTREYVTLLGTGE